MAREIIVTFDNGKVSIETKGFGGASCMEETRSLEKALGVKTDDVKTADYHKVAEQGAQNARKAGR